MGSLFITRNVEIVVLILIVDGSVQRRLVVLSLWLGLLTIFFIILKDRVALKLVLGVVICRKRVDGAILVEGYDDRLLVIISEGGFHFIE